MAEASGRDGATATLKVVADEQGVKGKGKGSVPCRVPCCPLECVLEDDRNNLILKVYGKGFNCFRSIR